MSLKLLFICSQNKRRSLTAERIFDGHDGHQARSAGTERGARIRVTAGLLGWADLIFVMEKRHHHRLKDKFSDALKGVPVVCLHVPDEFLEMDERLIERLWTLVPPYLAPDEAAPAGRSASTR